MVVDKPEIEGTGIEKIPPPVPSGPPVYTHLLWDQYTDSEYQTYPSYNEAFKDFKRMNKAPPTPEQPWPRYVILAAEQTPSHPIVLPPEQPEWPPQPQP